MLRIQRSKVGPGGPSTGSNVQGYSIDIKTELLLQASLSSLDADIRNKMLQEGFEDTHSIWVPGAILEFALPDLVQAYKASRRSHVTCPTPPNAPPPVSSMVTFSFI